MAILCPSNHCFKGTLATMWTIPALVMATACVWSCPSGKKRQDKALCDRGLWLKRVKPFPSVDALVCWGTSQRNAATVPGRCFVWHSRGRVLCIVGHVTVSLTCAACLTFGTIPLRSTYGRRQFMSLHLPCLGPTQVFQFELCFWLAYN